MTDRIALGVIRKAHGVRGEASVEAWTDSLDRFDGLAAVTLVSPGDRETRDVTIETARVHLGRALVKFAGIDSPEDVQRLQNWTIEIPESEARELEDGEYFLHDLVGLALYDAGGRARGVVIDVYEGGGGLLLNVKRPDGKEFELPFAADLCTAIDVKAKTMSVNIPVGLDDLDSVEE
ncbi:MAG TPA: ribosome maturation factor RimM [Thermoanaerobaculia bacterium]|nr:ribosome maturation factor RimM [Thermoanaerobaculia bacterium]